MLGDRRLFPTLDVRTYFNHASISPISTRVRDAAVAALDAYAAEGAAAWPTFRDQRDRLRGRLAALIGAAPDEIGLVPSTSQGVVDIALGLRWQPGDRVLLLEGEFPTNITPWQRAAETFGLEIEWLRATDFADGRGLESLQRALAARPVRLVAVSAVQFQTGLRMPLAEMVRACHEHGTEIFVDAIQAVGATPIDTEALGVDYLVAGSHKWLMAPEGCGLLYVRRARHAELHARVAGWLSHENAAAFLFEGPGQLRYDRPLLGGPAAFEIGAQNTVGFAALEASVEILLEIGVPAIHAHVQSILDEVEPTLTDRGFTSLRSADPTRRSTIASFAPPEDTDLTALHAHLAEAGIACAIPDGLLRISPHWPNDRQQVGHFATALDAL